jgi:RNA polymerase sigma-70 factor, ECF subfamily
MLSSHVMAKEIEEALKGLPEEFRTAIVLVDIDELTYEEAAQIMECPIGTVRSRLCRGRRILQLALRDYALERGLNRK